MDAVYSDMYDEYKKAIILQNKAISRNNGLLDKARKSHNFKEIKRLNALLLILYEERSELTERAEGLHDYIS